MFIYFKTPFYRYLFTEWLFKKCDRYISLNFVNVSKRFAKVGCMMIKNQWVLEPSYSRFYGKLVVLLILRIIQWEFNFLLMSMSIAWFWCKLLYKTLFLNIFMCNVLTINYCMCCTCCFVCSFKLTHPLFEKFHNWRPESMKGLSDIYLQRL